MPFDARLNNVYRAVQSIVEDYSGCRCLRADQITRPSQITGDIWEQIQRARFLMADITDQNPNVFYEIGFSHALHKNVILLVEKGGKVPFDIQGIRYVSYTAADLASLREQLPLYIKECLQTIPHQWRTDSTPEGPDVRISHVEWLNMGTVDQPLQVTAHARNFGSDARQAYLSLSFPSGVSNVSIARSDLQTKIGNKGDPWRQGEVILKYSIAEAYVYANREQDGWLAGKSHFITVTAIPKRRGLIQFYISASSQTGDRPFTRDPAESPVLDHRDIPVYCGVIEVP